MRGATFSVRFRSKGECEVRSGHQISDNAKALAIAAKLAVARLAHRRPDILHPPQRIEIHNLIQPVERLIRVLRATRAEKRIL
jgi:hypothetical protein